LIVLVSIPVKSRVFRAFPAFATSLATPSEKLQPRCAICRSPRGNRGVSGLSPIGVAGRCGSRRGTTPALYPACFRCLCG